MARYENVDGTFGDYQEVKSEYVLPGTEFSWSSDKSVEWQAAEVTWTAAEADKTQNIDILKQKYTFDISGMLNIENGDPIYQTSTKDWATFDVCINGKVVATNVYDYCKEERYGSTFEIRNIKTNTGYKYVGVNNNNGQYCSNLIGTIGDPLQILNEVTKTALKLEFKKIETTATLIKGSDFNGKATVLSGGNLANIKEFKKSDSAPDMSKMTNRNIANITYMPGASIYIWFDNQTLYWWSEAEKIYLFGNAEGMFSDFTGIESLDLTAFDSSKVTSMHSMFSCCTNLKNLNISNFDTSKVTLMSDMFYKCSSLETLDLSNFNTSNVINMMEMFYNCRSLVSLNVSSFNTSKVKTMQSMFDGCSALTSLNLNNFDTSNVFYMSKMFSQCKKLKSLNISNFSTSNVTTMDYMFYFCQNIESLNTNNFNTSNVTTMLNMFSHCENLKTLNTSKFDTNNVTNMNGMFSYCNNLTALDLRGFSNITSTSGIFRTITTTPLTIYNPTEAVKAYNFTKDRRTVTFAN